MVEKEVVDMPWIVGIIISIGVVTIVYSLFTNKKDKEDDQWM